MDKTQIIDELKHTNEILPNEYDGTYRSVRETVECYAKLRKTALLDYTDLELLYFLSLGIWNSDKSERKSRLEKSHLLYNDKITLERSLERIWCNGSKKLFTHRISDDELKVLTETVAFKDTDMAKNAEAVQFFIKMCINLAGLEKDSELYDTAQKMLNAKIKNAGIPIYVVSRILHSLKPFSFPIFANTKEHCEIYRTMGLELIEKDDVTRYITNCRKIRAFRDTNFKFKNMRVFDVMSWELLAGKIEPRRNTFNKPASKTEF